MTVPQSVPQPAPRRWIDTPEVAKLIRAELKALWPSIKFSVRSSRYAGGSSIDVQWTDGPAQRQVDSVIGKYAGASFDGMIDLQTYHDSTLNGERVHFGSDYVHGQRRLSFGLVKEMAAFVRRSYAIPYVPEPQDRPYGGFWTAEDNRPCFGNYSVVDLVMQEAYAYDATTGQTWDGNERRLLPLELSARHDEKYGPYPA